METPLVMLGQTPIVLCNWRPQRARSATNHGIEAQPKIAIEENE
jgi:hypothetical protein